MLRNDTQSSAGKGQACCKGKVNQEHKMRSGTLQNEALKYILLLFNDGINLASQLFWFLLLPPVSHHPSTVLRQLLWKSFSL